MNILRIILLFVITNSLILSQGSELKKYTFATHWLPQAQFAGYYIALEKGFYQDAGLNIEIVHGGPKKSSSDFIKSGEAHFASLWLTNAIQLKESGVNLINIAQLVHKSALMLIAKKNSGILKPEDMQGHKVGLWGGDFTIQPKAFFKKYNLDVKIVPQASSINLFLLDGVRVTSAMWYNEYHSIINSGYDPEDLTTFFFSDYGLNFPEEGLYVSESFLTNHTDDCKKFIEATLKGWMWAFENKFSAIMIVEKYMRQAKIPFNRSHQSWMLSRFEDMLLGNSKEIKIKLSEEDYNFVGQMLKENGLIKKTPPFSTFFKSIFN